MRQANPFTPSAGVEPPALIGREDVLYDFEESLLAGVGAPGRLMRITGPRFNQEKIDNFEEFDIREALDAQATPLTKKGKGLLVTVDEVQNAEREDITRVAIAVQL